MRVLLVILLLLAAMGSAVSVPLCLSDFGPKSILKCIDDDGWIDPEAFLLYRRRSHDKMSTLLHRVAQKKRALAGGCNDNHSGPEKKRVRRCKADNLEMFDASGNRVPADPTKSPWYLLYVTPSAGNLQKKKFQKKFRRRFRLPYQQYRELLADLEQSGEFNRWLSKDATGRPSSPLSIMLLGAL